MARVHVPRVEWRTVSIDSNPAWNGDVDAPVREPSGDATDGMFGAADSARPWTLNEEGIAECTHRFHPSWISSRTAAVRWLALFVYSHSFQRPIRALNDRTPAA